VFVFSQTTRIEQKKRSINHYVGEFKKSTEWYDFARKCLMDEKEIEKSLNHYWENSDKLQNLKQFEKTNGFTGKDLNLIYQGVPSKVYWF